MSATQCEWYPPLTPCPDNRGIELLGVKYLCQFHRLEWRRRTQNPKKPRTFIIVGLP